MLGEFFQAGKQNLPEAVGFVFVKELQLEGILGGQLFDLSPQLFHNVEPILFLNLISELEPEVLDVPSPEKDRLVL